MTNFYVYRRGLGTTILHDAETIIPEALPLITSLLKFVATHRRSTNELLTDFYVL